MIEWMEKFVYLIIFKFLNKGRKKLRLPLNFNSTNYELIKNLPSVNRQTDFLEKQYRKLFHGKLNLKYVEDKWTILQLNFDDETIREFSNYLNDNPKVSDKIFQKLKLTENIRTFTCSERIPNLLRIINNPTISHELQKNLLTQINHDAKYIYENLESYFWGHKDYAAINTNNHYLSNLRSLILYSKFTKQNAYISILIDEFNKAYHSMHTNHCLIEGSNCYNKVTNGYLLELACLDCLKPSVKINFYKKYLMFSLIEQQSKEFLGKDIYFGSFSPDPHPDRYMSKYKIKNESRFKRTNKNRIIEFEDRLLIQHREFKLCVPKVKFSGPRYHKNNAVGNIILFVGKNPLLIDAGTGTYDWREQKTDGRKANFHNSVTTDEKEIYPINKRILYGKRRRIIFSDTSVKFNAELDCILIQMNFFDGAYKRIFKRTVKLDHRVTINTISYAGNTQQIFFNIHHKNSIHQGSSHKVKINIKTGQSFIVTSNNNIELLSTRQYLDHRTNRPSKQIFIQSLSNKLHIENESTIF